MSALAAPAVPTRPDPVGALSADQTKAALTLAYGGTVSTAADAAGVHRSSIYNWFKSDPNFKQAVEAICRDRNERLSDQMRELESLALARLRRLLEDDSVPASVQLRAALAVLNRPKESSGHEDWNVPRMESLETTLTRKPLVAQPPAFDAPRQISTLFAASAGGVAGPESPRPAEIRTKSGPGLQPLRYQALKKPVSAAPDCPKISRQVYHNQRGR
jgi:AcrR family transcriptional regulator